MAMYFLLVIVHGYISLPEAINDFGGEGFIRLGSRDVRLSKSMGTWGHLQFEVPPN